MRISWLIFFLCVTLSSSFSLLVYGRKEMKRGESQANRHAAAGILLCIGVVLVLHKCAWLRLPEIKGLVYFSRIEPIFRRPLWCLCFLWGFWSPYRVVTHHQVAVNPQAGPHTVSLCWEKMRCNPPSMKSVFLLFSSAALPLVVLSFSIHPTVPTHSPLAGCSYWSLNE